MHVRNKFHQLQPVTIGSQKRIFQEFARRTREGIHSGKSDFGRLETDLGCSITRSGRQAPARKHFHRPRIEIAIRSKK